VESINNVQPGYAGQSLDTTVAIQPSTVNGILGRAGEKKFSESELHCLKKLRDTIKMFRQAPEVP
jgi:hypothetical protein